MRAKGRLSRERRGAALLVSPASHRTPPATGRKNSNLKETSSMSIVASVIAPMAPVAASVPRASVARHVPLPSQKVTRAPAHRGLVVARGGEISWDEADEILTLECVPNDAASYPRCVRVPRRIIARPAPDLSVRFRFRNPSVTNPKTRLTLGNPAPVQSRWRACRHPGRREG